MQRMAACALLLVGFCGFAATAVAQCNENCPQRRTILVTGTAQVTADADMAIVHVGYKLYGPDAKSAYSSALDTSNAVMQALTASGIPKSAIESTSQVLQNTPPYELQQFGFNKPEERELRQFMVMQSWTIRVKPDDASSVLNTAITAGANESGWIQWIVNDPSTLQARASAEATAHAHTIADQIAQRSNVHLGALVSVSQNQGPYSGPGYGAGSGGNAGGGVYALASGPLANQQLAINSRRVEYTVSVFAVYSIE